MARDVEREASAGPAAEPSAAQAGPAGPVAALTPAAVSALARGADPGVRARTLSRLQQSAGNRATARYLARDATKTAPERTSIKILGVECKTYGELAAMLRLLAAQVKGDIEGLDAESDVVKRAKEQIKDLEGWAAFLGKSPDQPLGGIVIGQTEHFATDVPKVRKDLEWLKDKPHRDMLEAIEDKIEAIHAQLKKMEPAMKEAARKAFKEDKESELAKLLNLIGGVLDNGLAVNDLGRQLSDVITKRAYGYQLAEMGKYAKALDKLNMGLAAVNLGISLTGDKATTELEEGGRLINIAAGAFSALGTLFKVAPHIGLYSNLYLVPMTEAIVKNLGVLSERLREGNREWVEFQGKPLRYGVEQGGEPMWLFMTSVMRAADPTGISKTPPKKVQEFFVDHRDRFKAGLGSDVPTSGVVFKDLDTSKFRNWVFVHRKKIWIMLYGSFPVPS